TYALITKTLAQIALKQPTAKETLHQALEIALQSQAEPLITAALYAAGEWYMMVNRKADADAVWTVISAHPATEMDYRRRLHKKFDQTASPHGSLHELATHALNSVS